MAISKNGLGISELKKIEELGNQVFEKELASEKEIAKQRFNNLLQNYHTQLENINKAKTAQELAEESYNRLVTQNKLKQNQLAALQIKKSEAIKEQLENDLLSAKIAKAEAFKELQLKQEDYLEIYKVKADTDLYNKKIANIKAAAQLEVQLAQNDTEIIDTINTQLESELLAAKTKNIESIHNLQIKNEDQLKIYKETYETNLETELNNKKLENIKKAAQVEVQLAQNNAKIIDTINIQLENDLLVAKTKNIESIYNLQLKNVDQLKIYKETYETNLETELNNKKLENIKNNAQLEIDSAKNIEALNVQLESEQLAARSKNIESIYNLQLKNEDQLKIYKETYAIQVETELNNKKLENIKNNAQLEIDSVISIDKIKTDLEAESIALKKTNIQQLADIQKNAFLLAYNTEDLQTQLEADAKNKNINDQLEAQKMALSDYANSAIASANLIAAKQGLETEDTWKAKIQAIELAKNAELEAIDKSSASDEEKAKKKAAIEAKAAADQTKLDNKYAKDKAKVQNAIDAEHKKKAAENYAAVKKELQESFSSEQGGILGGIKSTFKSIKNEDGTVDKSELNKKLIAAVGVLGDFVASLTKNIDEIASKKTAIDTRLQGSTQNETHFGSYWDKISNDIVGIAGVSPFVKQSDIVSKVEEMVGQGISFNVEQRAFLATISSKIATTFNAADGTLLKLIKIQQQDSTAARLGMESAMNSFLNNMYEASDYLNSLASSVRSSLYEAQALMSTKDAVGFEYQVQKWLGSLSSVGMSDEAVSSIASALGKASAGQLEGLTEGGAGNLLVMAANNANISISDMLTKGLDESDTNLLLNAMVNYLSKIYASTSDSRVLQQQFASVYGITASDLKAAANLSTSMSTINTNFVNYQTSLAQLSDMANSMVTRTSMGEMLNNALDNFQYTMSAGIANSPILYGTLKIANMLTDVAGGISIPAISAFGNMVDLHTNVADLMKVGALSGSMLKGIAQIAMAGSGGGFSGTGMLKAVGVDLTGAKANVVKRGTGEGLKTASGATVSEAGTMVGNGNGEDIKKQSLSSASEDSNKQLAEAKENSDEVTTNTINENIVNIYKVLQDVVNGSAVFHTQDVGYGLSGWSK